MISIIVPVYNAQQYIKETLDSVTAQTYTDWELLLVDDCSSDDSCEIIKSYIEANPEKRIRLIRQEQNGGAARARNRGVEEAEGRYIAFLDADDLWYPQKLEKQMQFIEKHNAGFTFTSYVFGDEKAIPTGKAVRVPETITYKQALSRTVIFTSTVLVDTEKTGKPFMPEIKSEDTATWWQILQKRITGYGLDELLVIYRRSAQSLSSNKKEAVKRIWGLYRKIAKLSIPAAMIKMFGWARRAVIRRIIDDTIRAHFEALKRFTVLQLSLIGLLFQTAMYGVFWFNRFYPELSAVRYNQDGKSLGIGLKLFFRGHILILVLYFVLLVFLSQNTGGMRTGFLKPWNAFSAEVTALLLSDAFTYFQLSLMKNWLLPTGGFLLLFVSQCVIAGIWSYLSYLLFRRVFPPRESLVVDLGESEELEGILQKFNTRQDRFRIMKTIRGVPMETIKAESMRWYGCVIVIGGEEGRRRELLEFCYKRFIRVYFVPEISDLLIQGSVQMELFDTPILELREYTIRWETRVFKRLLDIVLSGLILVLLVPVTLVRLAAGRKTEKAVCLGKNKKPFTRYGKGFVNVLNGSMSLVGPAAFEKEEAERRQAVDDRFGYRYRIKPGITGYAQLHKSDDPADQLKMDLYYMLHYSLLNDFKILLQSIRIPF